jgi:hypothetical protein
MQGEFLIIKSDVFIVDRTDKNKTFAPAELECSAGDVNSLGKKQSINSNFFRTDWLALISLFTVACSPFQIPSIPHPNDWNRKMEIIS